MPTEMVGLSSVPASELGASIELLASIRRSRPATELSMDSAAPESKHMGPPSVDHGSRSQLESSPPSCERLTSQARSSRLGKERRHSHRKRHRRSSFDEHVLSVF